MPLLPNFTEAAKDASQGSWKDIYGVLSRGGKKPSMDAQPNRHSVKDIDEVQNLLYEMVKSNQVRAGIKLQTLDEVRERMATSTIRRLTEFATNKGPASDSFFNPVTGYGTLTDPNFYSQMNMPITIGPMQGSTIYAQGGLPTIICDKKTKGIMADGISFSSHDPFWDDDKIKAIEEHSILSGATDVLVDAYRDATIQGGAILYPVLKDDTPALLDSKFDTIINRFKKDSIDYWVTADRWNVVFIPSFNYTAKDFLMPESVYIPLGGISVSTTRASVIRPRKLPYWAAIAQLGWTVSDFEGYMPSVYAYLTIMLSVPIMAQQMSLLLYKMPLNDILVQAGTKVVKEMMAINSEKMREWSILNPQALNLVGEIDVINRSFTGFDHFVDSAKADLAAKSEIPLPTLFHVQSKGFTDNTSGSLLKESEMLKTRQHDLAPQLDNFKKAIVLDTFGADSPGVVEHLAALRISFDKPLVATEAELAEAGARFSAAVNSLKQAGIPTLQGINLISNFFRGIKITREDEAAIQAYAELEENIMKVQGTPKEPSQSSSSSTSGEGKGKSPLKKSSQQRFIATASGSRIPTAGQAKASDGVLHSK